MKERTKKLMTGYDVYKAYDEQQKIKEKYYFKGCAFCDGVERPIMSRKGWMSDYIALQIKGNKLLTFSKKLKEIDYDYDCDYIYKTRYIGYRQINFCPFCGKQLVKNLK